MGLSIGGGSDGNEAVVNSETRAGWIKPRGMMTEKHAARPAVRCREESLLLKQASLAAESLQMDRVDLSLMRRGKCEGRNTVAIHRVAAAEHARSVNRDPIDVKVAI